MGSTGLALAAYLGATSTSLPPRLWMAEFFSLSFWSLALNWMQAPGFTLSLMSLALIATASAFGWALLARLVASAATSSASKVYTWLVFTRLSLYSFRCDSSSCLAAFLIGCFQA